MNMARRIGAFAAMLTLLGLALVLVWQVYRHHQKSGVDEREPEVVSIHASAVSV